MRLVTARQQRLFPEGQYQYTKMNLHQRLYLPESIDASMGDCLHVSQREAFAKQLDFGLILLENLLAAFPITFLSPHLAADTAEMVIPTFHP